MDFIALHLEVLPWMRLRKDKENVSNIFHWDNLAQASLHFSPSERQHKPICFCSPSPWDVSPTALDQLGMGKREQRREKSVLAAQVSQGITLGGKKWDTNLCIHNNWKVREGHGGC